MYSAAHLHVDVQKSSLGDLKHQAHFGARVHALVETLLRVSVDANEIAARRVRQRAEEHDEFRERKHVWCAVLMEDKTHKRDFTPRWTDKGGDFEALAALPMMPRQAIDEPPEGTKRLRRRTCFAFAKHKNVVRVVRAL